MSYIVGDFLPPLKNDELLSCFEKSNMGDKEAREKIIMHNIRLVLFVINNMFPNTSYDKRELFSVGLCGLVKSVDSFDLDRNVKFSFYATKIIKNEILYFFRQNKKHECCDSLYKLITNDKDNEKFKLIDTLKDIKIDIVSDYEKVEMIEKVMEILESFKERDKEIVKLYFGFYNNRCYSQKEIAKKFGVSKSRISRIVNGKLSYIKYKLSEEGFIEEYRILCEDERMEDDMSRSVKSIYVYLNEYAKEEIDYMLANLSDKDRNLVKLRYGDDLDNPVATNNFTKLDSTKFYSNLVPRMKAFLLNERKKHDVMVDDGSRVIDNIMNNNTIGNIEKKMGNSVIGENIDTNNKEVIDGEEIKDKDGKVVLNDDYIKMLENMKDPNFGKFIKTLSIKDAMILSLSFGCVDEKYFSVESIAEFLDMDKSEVRNSIKDSLLQYKDNLNQMIDRTIDVFESGKKSLVRSKNNGIKE